MSPLWVDNCSGQILETAGDTVDRPCEMEPPQVEQPCDEFTVTGGGITCEAFEWDVRANVRFPEIYLDVRPYPATPGTLADRHP